MDSWGIFAGGDNDRLGIYSYGGQAERVSVLESGNVGIGTTEPGAKLSIADSGTAAGAMFLQIGDDSFLTDVDAQNTLGLYGSQDSTTASIRLGSNGGTISGNNGNVGIGTTSPDSKLNVNGSLHVEGGGFGGTPLGEFGTFIDVDAANWNRIELRGSSGAYIDFSNDTTSDYDVRLRLVGDDALAIEGGTLNLGSGNLNMVGHNIENVNLVSSPADSDLTIDARRGPVGTLTLQDNVRLPDGNLDMVGHWINNATNLNSPSGSDLSVDAGYGSHNTLNLLDDVRIPEGNLDMVGHDVNNVNTIYVQDAHCGALVEANLQTPEEQELGGSDRFEEGDVLCWAEGRLEKCTTANDRLVQAVANAKGEPIVIGAEAAKVLGPVQKGDLLVASDVPGFAMVNNDPAPGTVIAQALEDFEGEKGIIKAMIRKF